MSRHDHVVTLRQIEEFAIEARDLAHGRTRADLDTDLSLRRHAERIVTLIGEAANRLPPAVHDRYPQVPWRSIIGMRNRLIHGYEGVDYEVVWDVIGTRAGALAATLPAIIDAERRRATKEEPGK